MIAIVFVLRFLTLPHFSSVRANQKCGWDFWDTQWNSQDFTNLDLKASIIDDFLWFMKSRLLIYRVLFQYDFCWLFRFLEMCACLSTCQSRLYLFLYLIFCPCKDMEKVIVGRAWDLDIARMQTGMRILLLVSIKSKLLYKFTRMHICRHLT